MHSILVRLELLTEELHITSGELEGRLIWHASFLLFVFVSFFT